MSESEKPYTYTLPLKPFLLLLLALAALAGISLWFTAWCWPRYGESACGRYVLPIDFLMSLVIFALVTLVFDQRWGKLALYSLLTALVIVAGSLVARMLYTATAIPLSSLPDLLRFLQASLLRLIYLALIQTFVPAALLRLLTRAGDRTHHDTERGSLRGDPGRAVWGIYDGFVRSGGDPAARLGSSRLHFHMEQRALGADAGAGGILGGDPWEAAAHAPSSAGRRRPRRRCSRGQADNRR